MLKFCQMILKDTGTSKLQSAKIDFLGHFRGFKTRNPLVPKDLVRSSLKCLQQLCSTARFAMTASVLNGQTIDFFGGLASLRQMKRHHLKKHPEPKWLL